MVGPRVDDIYEKLKSQAISFRLPPGNRINEGALARELGVSRTPLREALNRLVAERMFDFRPGQGFFCRPLDTQGIYELFQLRGIIETAASRLTCENASDAALSALNEDLYQTGIDVTGLTVAQAVERDEAFHMEIARLSGNGELVETLGRISERIRYIRWISMTRDRIESSKDEHKMIMQALLDRSADNAAALLGKHISKRMDQVQDAVRQGISSIYMDAAEDIQSRVITE